MLGIIVGIITIAGLLTLSFGVRDSITESINGLGANLITVLPGNIEEGGFGAQFGASTLTERDVQAVRDRVPQVHNLSVMMFVNGTIAANGNELAGGIILGATAGVEYAFNLSLDDGRLIQNRDDADRTRVAVIGATTAEELFGMRNPVGQDITVRSQPFKIIGVLEEIDAGASFGGPDMNRMVILPLATAWELTNTHQIDRIIMQAPDPETIDTFKAEVEEAILEGHNGEDDFSVLTQDDLAGMVGEILNMITAFIGAIAGISLFVGGIGIMNIMLVTVSERTREIGIRKAIGATRIAILTQFLIESIILTGIAGGTAILFFSAVVALVAPHSPIPLSVDPQVVILALLFSGGVGIVFGLIPAWQASKKEPLEALRSE